MQDNDTPNRPARPRDATRPRGDAPDRSRTKKPTWVIDKERARRASAAETVWLFGLHAVRDALANPARERLRLVLTRNAADRLGSIVGDCGMEPEIVDARSFDKVVPLAGESVHQGAALEVKPLGWGKVEDVVLAAPPGLRPLVVALDRVTDPHNVGAILRSAEVFGAQAVIAPARHAAPETGALAKTASGALERQPYLRITNLADTLVQLKWLGYVLIALDGAGEQALPELLATLGTRPVCIVLGAEGPGLRDKTIETCDHVARIPFAADFGSLNVSNAAAVALYAVRQAG